MREQIGAVPTMTLDAMVQDLNANTRVIPKGVGGELGQRLQIYPQLFVIDRGRSCGPVLGSRSTDV